MKIILFDGVCNFCNATVNFILIRDKQEIFRFSPQQSEKGRKLLEQHGKADTALETIVFIDGDEWMEGMEAVIGITRQMKGYSWLSLLLRIIPRKISNAIYAFIAGNRYRWFGRRDACRLPNQGEEERFL
jgi:predicted DCC family thiol-disulfide oxidoreductase YuxK